MLLLKTTSFQVKVLQKKFTLLHADFSKIVLKYSNEVHLLRYLTLLAVLTHLELAYHIFLTLHKAKAPVIFPKHEFNRVQKCKFQILLHSYKC